MCPDANGQPAGTVASCRYLSVGFRRACSLRASNSRRVAARERAKIAARAAGGRLTASPRLVSPLVRAKKKKRRGERTPLLPLYADVARDQQRASDVAVGEELGNSPRCRYR